MKYFGKFALFCFVLLYVNTSAQQLFPDNSFGTNGVARNNFSAGYDDFYALRAQPNGGLIAGGLVTNFTQDILIVRYTSAGVLDENFGEEGKFILDIQNSTEMLNFISIQPDNKILFAGYSIRNNVRRGVVGRVNADGSPDITFGVYGIVEFVGLGNSSFTELESVKLHTDGSVFVTGTTLSGSLERAFVKKFNDQGIEDTTFGTNGYADVVFGVTNSRNYGFDLEVMPDGGIILLGRYFVTRFQMGLAKFTPQGILDNTFTGGGKTFFDYTTGQNYARRLIRLSDNSFYALAHCNATGLNYQNYIGKFNPDGTADVNYGNAGKFSFSNDTDGNFVWDAVAFGDHVLITDYSFGVSTTFSNVHLITPTGEKATSFGNNGSFTLSGLTTYGQGVTFIGDDIFYAGAEFIPESSSYHSFVRKLNSSGNIENSFGQNGAVTVSYSVANTSPISMYKSANGDIFTVGTVRNNNNDQYVAKYDNQGILDIGFGTNGVSVANLGGTEEVKDVVELENGEAVVIAERGTVTLNFSGLGNFTAPGNYSLLRISPSSGFQTSSATNTNINPSQFTRGVSVKELPDGKLLVLAMSTTANQRSGYLLRHNSNLTLDNTFGDQGNGRIEINSLTNEEFFSNFIITNDEWFIVASSTFTGTRIRKMNSSGDFDLSFGQTFPGISEYFGLHSDGLNHIQATDIYAFEGGFFVLGVRGVNNYAVARMNNSGQLTGYIALPGFKRVSGLTVETDGNFAAYGVNEEEKWLISKIDVNGNPVNSFGIDGSLTVTAYDGITLASHAIAENNGGLILLSGQRSGVNGFDNSVLKLIPETPTTALGSAKPEIVLFPNPLSGNELFVTAAEDLGTISNIYLIDMKGRKSEINQLVLEGNKMKVSLPLALNPGIYYLELNHEEGRTMLKFLKN